MSACMSAEPVHTVRTHRAAAATVTLCVAQFSVIYRSMLLMEIISNVKRSRALTVIYA